MQIAILGFSVIGAVTGSASLYIMWKTRKALVQFGEDIKSEVANVKTTTNQTIVGLKSALDGIEL